MRISFIPIRYDYNLALTVQEERIVLISIGGDDPEVLDFTDLPEGAVLPAEAIASEWIVGPVARTGGELHLTIRLPHSAVAPESTRFPEPIHVTWDGDVPVPEWGDDPASDTVAVINGVEMNAADYAAYVAEQGGPTTSGANESTVEAWS